MLHLDYIGVLPFIHNILLHHTLYKKRLDGQVISNNLLSVNHVLRN